jgi:hypothetical protein
VEDVGVDRVESKKKVLVIISDYEESSHVIFIHWTKTRNLVNPPEVNI